jgi:hypothetical protein
MSAFFPLSSSNIGGNSAIFILAGKPITEKCQKMGESGKKTTLDLTIP